MLQTHPAPMPQCPMNATKAVKTITVQPQGPMNEFKKLVQIGRQ